MNKAPWVVALLPLAVIALYYVSNRTPEVTQPARTGSAASNSGQNGVIDQRIQKKLIMRDNGLEGELRKQTGDGLKENAEAAMLAVANAATPANQKKNVEAEMRAREPRYRSLFDSWGIDQSKAREVLSMIGEREKRISDLRLKMFKKGIDQASAVQKEIDSERSLVDTELVILLGPERFVQFAKIDAELNVRGRKSRLRD